jgi:putative CocE/NonD family hydrolase
VNLAGVRIGYPDRAEQDRKLLTYDSAALAHDTEVTGHPLVVLHLASSASDGQLFVYLEDIGPAGDVEYVTEGELRLIHRHVEDVAPYRTPSLYRSFSRAAAEPMIPGESAEILIDLLPTSYLFRRGHRVRLAIAGADRDNFVAPAGPPPDLTIFREAARPSRIELPVVHREAE